MSDVNNPGSPGKNEHTFAGTLFFHEAARHKKEFTLTPDELVGEIETSHATRKNSLRWIKLARFGNLATAKGSLRHDRNVLAITGVEADYDGEEIAFDDMVEKLEAAGIEAIAYTSPSHKEDKPRWRVLAPLSREYRGEERMKFVARLNGLFGGALGVESFTLSQSYYFGYVGNGTAPASHRAKYIAGDFIDMRGDLDAGAIGKSGKSKKNGNAYENYGEDQGERLDFKAAVKEIVSGGDYHVSMRSIIASMMARGTEELIVKDIANGIHGAATLQRPDLKGREKEIPKIIEWVKEQEEKKQEAKKTPPPSSPCPPPPGTGTAGAAGTTPPPPPSGAAGTTQKPALPPDITIDDFYAYLPQHQYLYVPTQTLWPAATISSRLAKTGGVKPTRWLDRNKPVSQFVWAPGEPQIVHGKHLVEGGWIEKPGAIVFNQYREPPLLDGDASKAGPWLDLLKFLYPNPMEHGHIITVFAFKLQHPELKINHAIVLAGGMRIGKDTILEPIKRALGEWNVQEAKPSTIMGAFNSYMKSTLLMINETRDLGDIKRHEFYNHMKGIIATPPKQVLLNEKHKKETHILNVCLVVMTTNYRTDGVYLPPDDGRHFPVWSEVKKEDHEPEFFTKFYSWLDHGGDAHAAAYLRSLDVSSFDRGASPPPTELFHEIVDQGTPLETAGINEILNDMGRPPVFVIASLVARASGDLLEFLQNKGNARALMHRIEDCGYTRVRHPSNRHGTWRIGGKDQNVYGDKNLPEEIRRREAAAYNDTGRVDREVSI